MKIIAVGSNAEKGRSLERHVGALLTILGFKDLRYNIHKTGLHGKKSTRISKKFRLIFTPDEMEKSSLS